MSARSFQHAVLLHNILAPLPTPSLLPVTRVSHRFCDLTLRILHHRLALAASLGDRTLLLECYHPSVKLTEPPILCKYLGTKGLDDFSTANIVNESPPPPGQTLHEYNNLYSRFWPYREEHVKARRRYRHPAGDIPGSRTYFADPPPDSDPNPQHQATSSNTTSTSSHDPNGEEAHEATSVEADEETTVYKTVKQLVNLDSGELFSQLQATTTLVKIGPRGLFFSTVAVSDGVMRVFRNWLAEISKVTARHDEGGNACKAQELGLAQVSLDETQRRKESAASIALEGENSSEVHQEWNCKDDDHPAVLWVNDGRNVGVRFSVRERKWRKDKPILFQHEEELAVSYEIQFEEVLVRTRHLLMATEKSLLEQQSISGKAVVFGVWG
ncbi:MAG: hypothetical protein M1831_005131 [Alyxoria varia]|nr:MAG: hypothetical protein M1831_005131 [Alyxoria varia]